MADTARISTYSPFDLSEADDLCALARKLAKQLPRLAVEIDPLIGAFKGASDLGRPYRAEQAAETFARDLRRLWLGAAADEAASVFRSPTAGQAKRIARHHDGFGYERDLQPESLERRCAGFFPARPEGWRQDHVIFSSGQAAMTTALLALGRLLHADGAPLRLAHRGAYFETRALIRSLPFIVEATFAQTADVIIDEPVCCDGQFHEIDTSKLLSASPRVVIFDTTLMGRQDGVDRYLAALQPGGKQIVLRVTSSLKLLQGGFELANAGILSVYTSHGDADDFAGQLRRLRTLAGAGIHLVDAIALEAPWFLDAEHTDTYVQAVFDHNARLAEAVAKANRRFAPVSHPELGGAAAPYCAFQLREPSPEAYDALDREIAGEAARRKLNLSRGGSFGFRGHRYEIVVPYTGEPSFLRIALGRRGGWTCERIIAMMAQIAAK